MTNEILFQDKPLLYWAVLNYYRWWLWADRPESYLVENEGLTDRSIARIGIYYEVSRGLLVKKRKKLAIMLEKWADRLSSENMSKRADNCISFATHASSKKLTRGRQISATTKLAWFIEPKYWTLFDELAAAGVGILDGNPIDKCRQFYERLELSPFKQRSDTGNALIGAAKIGDFRMERVFDHQFWLVGLGQKREPVRLANSIATAAAFLAGLPAPIQGRLRRLARKIAEDVQPILFEDGKS
jgi:hypothetical protein